MKIRPPSNTPTPMPDIEQTPSWDLRLYVAGQTPKSLTAFENLKKICDEHLAGQYRIEVIDLLEQPQLSNPNSPRVENCEVA